jgi:hypothetical protein
LEQVLGSQIFSEMPRLKRFLEYVVTALRLDPLNARTPYLNMLGVIYLQAAHQVTRWRKAENGHERSSIE